MREHSLLLLLRKQLIVCRRVLSTLNKNYLPASTISPYLNTSPLYKTEIINKIIDCSETSFSKTLHGIETSQMICNANQLTGFYMTQVFTKGVSEQTIANLFPYYYTQSKGNTLKSCYTLTDMRFT